MRPNSALLVAAALLPSTLASVTAQITVVKPVDPIPPARHAYHAARLASCPPVVYPDSLKRRGIGGRVVLEAVVDTLGHVPRSGIVVRESPHAALARAAIDMAVGCRFVPARVGRIAVQKMVTMPVDFTVVRRRS